MQSGIIILSIMLGQCIKKIYEQRIIYWQLVIDFNRSLIQNLQFPQQDEHVIYARFQYVFEGNRFGKNQSMMEEYLSDSRQGLRQDRLLYLQNKEKFFEKLYDQEKEHCTKCGQLAIKLSVLFGVFIIILFL